MPFTNAEKIASVTDFNQLYFVLNEIGEIIGGDGITRYPADWLVTRIQKIRDDFTNNGTTLTDAASFDAQFNEKLRSITSSDGLRVKVRELLTK